MGSIAHFSASRQFTFSGRPTFVRITPSGVTKKASAPGSGIAVSAGRTLDAIPSGGDGEDSARVATKKHILSHVAVAGAPPLSSGTLDAFRQ